jgi:hypothetical protein
VEDRVTRLRPAKRLEEWEDDDVSGFGAREDRLARREARRDRRQTRRDERRERKSDRKDARKEQRQERRVDRVERKQNKARDKLARAPGGAPPPVYAPPPPGALAPEPTLQPAPSAWPPPPKPKKKPGEWLSDVVDQVEEVLEDGELDPEDLEEELEATEGMGAWPLPGRRVASGDAAWGPAVRMGRRLRIQAALGSRAAVIDLKPGLYLVAEIPDAVTRTEFGVAPLMLTAACRAIDEPPRERRGPLASLFRRRRDEPVRYVQVQAPSALPGPVEQPAAVVVPAPDIGWADDATVAAVYGCDPCERQRR